MLSTTTVITMPALTSDRDIGKIGTESRRRIRPHGHHQPSPLRPMRFEATTRKGKVNSKVSNLVWHRICQMQIKVGGE